LEKIIQLICQKEGLKGADIQPLSGGQVNQVLRIDGEFVLRIGAREGALARLSRETELMRSLVGEIPVPEILAFGQQEGRVYQVQRFVPGKKLYLVWKDLSPAAQDSIAAELAGYLKRLNRRPFANFGNADDENLPARSWSDFLSADFQHTLDEIKALNIRMVPGFIELAVDYFEAHRSVLQDGVPVLIHGDLTLVNILVDQGKISALLDFEHAMRAPMDYELEATEAFCLYPNDWAEEDHEVFCTADFASFFPLLQKHYPALFETPNLRERVNLYHLEACLGSHLAWRKDNLSRIPPERMAAKEFYLARIANFIFRNGTRLF
jgi:aminoglycoside phosphotransferase